MTEVLEVVDGEVVGDAGGELVLREGLDLSDPGQVRELERRLEQMGVDGDTSGLAAAEKELSAAYDWLRKTEILSEQMRTLGILRIRAWAELGRMDDLELVAETRSRASLFRQIAAVQDRGRLPELISWAQKTERWGLGSISGHIVPWGCGHVRRGALRKAIERSTLSVKEIAERSGASVYTVNALKGSKQGVASEKACTRVRFGDAQKVGAVVGYEGNYPPAPLKPSTTEKVRRTRERRLYGKSLPAAGDWGTVQDAAEKIRSAIKALDAAGQNVEGLYFRCDDLARAAQEGLKGLR